jgi:hypothetical protein
MQDNPDDRLPFPKPPVLSFNTPQVAASRLSTTKRALCDLRRKRDELKGWLDAWPRRGVFVVVVENDIVVTWDAPPVIRANRRDYGLFRDRHGEPTGACHLTPPYTSSLLSVYCSVRLLLGQYPFIRFAEVGTRTPDPKGSGDSLSWWRRGRVELPVQKAP